MVRQQADWGGGMKNLIAFGYYGGKFSHLDWLLPLLPTDGITHYCEPFGGSAAVLLNRQPAPVETYNDLDGDIGVFFKVLREQRDTLLDALACTPFSRAEYALACQNTGELSELERARRLYVRISQGFAQIPNATPGRWGYVITQSRNDMGGRVSSFYNGLDRLGEVAKRLLRVQIENEAAIKVIQRYDTPETLFYLDPPYTPDVCYVEMAYRFVMTLDEHRELLQVVKQCKGKVAISGYDNPLYVSELAGWHRTLPAPKNIAVKREIGDRLRQEVLWSNYDPAVVLGMPKQLEMFSTLEAVNV